MPPQATTTDPNNTGINVVPRSTGERVTGAFNAATSGAVGLDSHGTPLDDAIAAHHQARLDQARKHYADATTYAGVLAHGMDPETGEPLDDAGKQKYSTLRDGAWDAYSKIAGVSPETKKAIDQHKTVTDAIIQHGQSQQGQGKGFPAPPGAPTAAPASAAPADGGMPPPPGYSSKSSLGTPALREDLADNREFRNYSRKEKFLYQQRIEEDIVKAQALAANPRIMRYSPKVMGDQLPDNPVDIHGVPIPDEKLVKGTVFSSPDGGRHWMEVSGDYQYQVVGNRKLLTNKRTGEVVQDLGVVNLGATSEHEVMGVDAHGNPVKGTLTGSRAPVTAAPSGATTAPSTPARPSRLPAPPSTTAAPAPSDDSDLPSAEFNPRTGAPIAHAPDGSPASLVTDGTDAKGRPSLAIQPTPGPGTPRSGTAARTSDFFTPAMQKSQQEKATPVRLAARQLMGDPNQPEFKSLMDYGDLADSPKAQEHVRVAWDVIKKNMEDAEARHLGTLSQIFSNYMGLPQALASSEFDVARDAVGKLSSREKELLDREFAAYGTVMGLRSLTKGSAARFSVASMEREVPILGVSALSSRQFYDKLGLLNEEIMSGMEGISDRIMPDKSYYVQMADKLGKLAKQKLPPPPGGTTTAEDLERKLNLKH